MKKIKFIMAAVMLLIGATTMQAQSLGDILGGIGKNALDKLKLRGKIGCGADLNFKAIVVIQVDIIAILRVDQRQGIIQLRGGKRL